MLYRLRQSTVIVGIFVLSTGLSGCDNSKDVITSAELAMRIDAGTAPLILDVRTPEEYAAEHIPGAINISHTELDERLPELASYKHEEIVVLCVSGKRTALAAEILLEAGFADIRDLKGHMQQWTANGYPLE